MLIRYDLWNIADDKIDGAECPNTGNTNTKVYDDATLNLYLITKKEIKILSFYGPEFHEKQCPGRKGRQAILKINDIFDDFFHIDYSTI